MQHRTDKRRFIENKHAEQNIADLTDRGISQPFFKPGGFQRHHGAHEHRDKRQNNQRGLYPGAFKERSPHGIVQHPDNTQNAHLGNHAAKDGAGGSRSHGVRGGQPAVHGEKARLRAKADDGNQ